MRSSFRPSGWPCAKGDLHDVTAASLKWKYASAAAASLLLALMCVAALLLWRFDVDTQHLSSIAAKAVREHVVAQLQARADRLAADVASAPWVGGAALARSLQPYIQRESALRQLSVTSGKGGSFEWQRKGPMPAQAITAQAIHAVPGADAQVRVQLAQALPLADLSAQLDAARLRDEQAATGLAALLALLAAGAGGLLAGRWGGRLEQALRSLIQGLAGIGQGQPPQPLAAGRRDVIGQLQQALMLRHMQLRQSTVTRRYLQSVLNSMNDAVLMTSPEGIIRLASTAALELLGTCEEQLVGESILGVLDPPERPSFDLNSRQTLETAVRTRAGQTIPVCLSGAPIDSEDPELCGHIFVARNISDRKRAERRIRYLASYDALTKLPNRMQFQHLLQQAITRAVRGGQTLALLYLDIDRFKEVNDTFGHGSGDRVLEVLAERLTRCLPRDMVLGRLAGDELAVIVEGLGPAQGLPQEADPRGLIVHLARSALTEIGRVFQVNEREIFLTASIGIALCPRDADNVIDLIRDADAAMYHAKQTGGNAFTFYEAHMHPAAVERLVLKGKLRLAIERDELVVRYQPKIDLRDGRILGAEALLRWRLPGSGDIPPSTFIPLAEETHLIEQIGYWVLERVCKDHRQIQTEGADPGRISLNLSLKQLRQAGFILQCRRVFREWEVPPSAFELEITETTLMADAPRTVRLLEELAALGLHLSIDDFGTGYSSLSALRQFPIGTLKIDQSFVRNVSEDAGDATIVRTIIQMGRNLGIEVIAEGVESLQQLDFLRREGCQGAQGRLFGEPLAAEELLALLKRQTAGAAPFGNLLDPHGAAAHSA